MIKRGDGVLRLPAQAMELGGVLADRANAFLARYPKAEETLRRVLTLKLATVREDGEPTRRLARRSEFTEEEWRLVSELADHPHRLLVTATPEAGETYAEVAHEATSGAGTSCANGSLPNGNSWSGKANSKARGVAGSNLPRTHTTTRC